MAKTGKSSSISAFDEMLAQNQRELDALYSGPVSSSRTPSVANPTPRPAPSSAASHQARRREEPSSATVRNLNERYGDKWRYDVVDRRREGDEIIVLCKLSLEDGDISKAQFGSAAVGSIGSNTAGSAGGMSFSFGATGSPQDSLAGDPEDLAYKRAVDAALAKCAAML